MAIITWGMLEKSQIDPQTIEERIIELIAEHSANEEAHLGAGQSLQSHKAAAIIDHLAASIIADKIKSGEVTREKILPYQAWNLPFESIDGYSQDIQGTGYFEALIQALKITVSAEADSIMRLWVGGVYNITPIISKNPIIQFSMKLGDPDFYTTYVVWGNRNPWNAGEPRFFGFKVKYNEPTKVYGVYQLTDLTEIETELVGINPTADHFYRAEISASGATLKFYVDGVLKATVSPGWAVWDSDYLFCIATKTRPAGGENPPAFFWNFSVQQDL